MSEKEHEEEAHLEDHDTPERYAKTGGKEWPAFSERTGGDRLGRKGTYM